MGTTATLWARAPPHSVYCYREGSALSVHDASSHAGVTAEEVRHIADLSNLRLTSEEEIAMQRDLSAILTYVAELNELDTTSVEPMAQVGEVIRSELPSALDSRDFLRTDDLCPSLQREDVMAAAPETDGTFFKVPKVIER